MKRALITGGSGDIGTAICQRLAQQNIHVIIHSNSNMGKAQATADQIHSLGGSAEVICFDVTDAEDTKTKLVGLTDLKPIQIIINKILIGRGLGMFVIPVPMI